MGSTAQHRRDEVKQINDRKLAKARKGTGAVSHGGDAVRLSNVKGSLRQNSMRKQDVPGGRNCVGQKVVFVKFSLEPWKSSHSACQWPCAQFPAP